MQHILLSLGAIAMGFWLLMWSADKFVDGAAAIAHNLGIPPIIIGLTIVGFATSAPEIFISIFAALDNNGGIAIGNAIGSNITNSGLILGVTAFLYPLTVRRSLLLSEVIILFIAMLGCYWLLADYTLSRLDGALLLIGMLLVLVWLVISSIRAQNNQELQAEFDSEIPHNMRTATAAMWLLIGLVVLILSAKILVWGAVNIAQAIGISDLVIGLTIVALGTSLPELAATLSSAKKGQSDLAVGNIIGSNLFNILAVLGAASAIAPLKVEALVLWRDMPAMLISLILFVILCLTRRQGRDFGLYKLAGAVLVGAYGIYLGILLYQSL